jgi:hypothetical protein
MSLVERRIDSVCEMERLREGKRFLETVENTFYPKNSYEHTNKQTNVKRGPRKLYPQ